MTESKRVTITLLMNTAIIEKVRKLRALAQSSNVNEAANAARLAEKLLQEHNLSAAEIDAPEADVYGGEIYDRCGRQIPSWKVVLSGALRDAYSCATVSARGTGQRYVYGRRQDIETFKYQYAWYTIEIERLTKRAMKGQGRTAANSFRLGAVSAIKDAMKSARDEVRAQATSAALVKVDERAKLAIGAMNAAHGKTTTFRSGVRSVDGNAYEAGRAAGAGLGQRTAIGSGGARLLGA